MATDPTLSRPTAPFLSIARELDEVLSLRGEERVDRLLESGNLEALVARMPPEELYFTLKETNEENVPALLAGARSEQLQFLLDLELWRRDRLRTDRVAAWLRRTTECGDEALTRWIRHLDVTTWSLLLGSQVKVQVQDEETDPFQDTPGRAPLTVDGVYYVRTSEELETVVQALLLSLRSAEPARYHQLMESLHHEVDSEFEEQCHEDKERRLAGRGFPSWEEAYHVYARLTDEGLQAAPRRNALTSPDPVPGEEPMAAPHYPITAAGVAPDLLTRALRRRGDAAASDAFRGELACLTNKVLVADGLDVGQLASFQRALAKVAGYVSIGLETLCGLDDEAAAHALSEHWLEHLFRAGWTRVREAQHHARRFLDKGWPQGKMERLLFLDSPLPELVDALLHRHPLWYAGEQEGPSTRDFRTLSEVRKADQSVEKADFLGRFLLSVIDFRLADLQEAAVRLDADSLKGRTVFLTALLNAALDREFRFAPVERHAARQGLAKIWRADTPPRRARPELAEAAVDWSKQVAPVSSRDETYLREFVVEALALLEEEFGHLAPDEAPDPRFTKGLWIV
ncbi:MAG: hypothetical protein HZB55_08545 [Deltaproteobacteria bacterium]|nr:hypothetical protein [Deltaproteobacteria bacterium]